MLARRRRRRANIKPALGQRLVFAGMCLFARMFQQILSTDQSVGIDLSNE